MNDIQLSENFKLSEFTRSETARRFKINNDAPESVIENLRNLCQNVLQPLRDYVGEPITISSGYRCAMVNNYVGGSKNSQHKFGEAADIRLPVTSFKWHDGERHTDKDEARRWFDFIKYNTDYDQLILETTNQLDFWIHVSCRRDPKLNRPKWFTICQSCQTVIQSIRSKCNNYDNLFYYITRKKIKEST